MTSPSKAATLAPIPEEWSDSCSCFLVLCGSDLDDDPDQRLRLYTNAVLCAQQDARTLRRHTLEADETGHADPCAVLAPPLSTSSSSSSASSVSTWVDVLLTGVQDPWSRVRSVAADGLCATVLAVVAEPSHATAGEDEDGQAREEDSFVIVSASSTPRRRSSAASAMHSGAGGGGPRRRASSVRTAASVNMTSLSGVSSVGGHSPHPAKRLSFRATHSGFRTPVTGMEALTGAAPSHMAAVTPTRQQLEAQKSQRRFLMDIFSKLFVKWARTQHWYAREGMLRVWQQLLPVMIATAEDNVTRMVVQKVCLPALTDPQVPVRDAASTLLATLAGASPLLATIAMDRVRQSLEALAATAATMTAAEGDSGVDDGASVSQAGEAAAYAAEGYLKGLVKLCAQQDAENELAHVRQQAADSTGAEAGGRSSTPPLPAPPALEAFAPLLMQFASHPASSVRQCVAAALGTHSEALFALLIRSLASTVTSSEPPVLSSSAAATAGLSTALHCPTWQLQETVLMALSEHLHFYLAQDGQYQLDLLELFAMPEDRASVVAFCAGGPVPPAMLATLTHLVPDLESARRLGPDALAAAVARARKFVLMQQCLCVLCDAAQSPRFEISRMSLQVVPLFLQLWVRFSTHVADLLHILHRAVPASVFGKAVVDALHGEVAASADAIVAALAAQPSFYFYAKAVLAPLWWFLTVRFYAHVDDDDEKDGENAASLGDLVRLYGTPLYWLRYISEAAGGDGGGNGEEEEERVRTPSSTAEALRLLTPLLPHLCSVNLLVATYFGGFFRGARGMATEESEYDDEDDDDEATTLENRVNPHLLVLEPELWAAMLAAGPPSAAASLRTAVPTREYLHVGLDFVGGLSWRRRLGASPTSPTSASPLSSVLQRVQRLVPVWVRALPSLQTHQQCVLLSMTRTALGVDALPERLLPSLIGASSSLMPLAGRRYSSSSNSPSATVPVGMGASLLLLSTTEASGASSGAPHLFRFVYRSTFRAPAMLDGGEDVPRGYTWLRDRFPTEMDAPPVTQLYTNGLRVREDEADRDDAATMMTATTSTGPVPPLPLDPRVESAVSTDVLATLYVDPGVEPAVLREVRLLMAGLCLLAREDDSNGTTTTTTHIDWWRETVAAVFARLDRIGPNWRTTAGGADAPSDGEGEEGDDWDDWDNDSEEDDAVQGISVPQEVREARSLLSQLCTTTTTMASSGDQGEYHDALHALLDKPETL